jgi:DNA-binding protein H-NS
MPTLEQIEANIAKLQAQAVSLRTKQSQSVLSQIHKLMAEHGLTAEDLAAYSGGKKQSVRSSAPKASAAPGKAAVKSVGVDVHRGQRTGPQPAKFRDPKTGATWSGRGPAPAWLASAKDRSKFAIAGTDGASANSVAEASVAKKAPAKKAATAKTADKAATAKATQKPAGKKVPAKKTSTKSIASTPPGASVEETSATS